MWIQSHMNFLSLAKNRGRKHQNSTLTYMQLNFERLLWPNSWEAFLMCLERAQEALQVRFFFLYIYTYIYLFIIWWKTSKIIEDVILCLLLIDVCHWKENMQIINYLHWWWKSHWCSFPCVCVCFPAHHFRAL